MPSPSNSNADQHSSDEPLHETLVGPGSRQFSMTTMTPQELHRAIHDVPVSESDEKLTQIELLGVKGQANALMRLDLSLIHI